MAHSLIHLWQQTKTWNPVWLGKVLQRTISQCFFSTRPDTDAMPKNASKNVMKYPLVFQHFVSCLTSRSNTISLGQKNVHYTLKGGTIGEKLIIIRAFNGVFWKRATIWCAWPKHGIKITKESVFMDLNWTSNGF